MEENPFRSPRAAGSGAPATTSYGRRVLSAFGVTWATLCLLGAVAGMAMAVVDGLQTRSGRESIKAAAVFLVMAAGFLAFGIWIRRSKGAVAPALEKPAAPAIGVLLSVVLLFIGLFALVIVLSLAPPGRWQDASALALFALLGSVVGTLFVRHRRRRALFDGPQTAASRDGGPALDRYNEASSISHGEAVHGQAASQAQESQSRPSSGQ